MKIMNKKQLGVSNDNYIQTSGPIFYRAGMINQLILKTLLIIDYKFVISTIPKDILFKYVTASNVQYGRDRKP